MIHIVTAQSRRPRKTSTREDHIVVNTSKVEPFKSSKQLKVELESSYGINRSSRTIRRRLNEAALRGCITQRQSFISKKNLKSSLNFVKENFKKPMSYWKNFFMERRIQILQMEIRRKTLCIASSTPTTQSQIHHQNN